MINKKVLLFAFLFLFAVCQAQKKAVTETGDEVILYENGTWKYLKDFTSSDSVKTNAAKFEKSGNATFLLKSKNGTLGFWLDPKKWNFKKATLNSSAEFEFELKGGSLQGLVVTENADIPIESYISLAVENGKLEAPDFHIVNKEYRIVNDLKVLYLQMEGTQSGIKFGYSGYYFSDSNATVQFLAFTYQNSIKKYANDIDELLNGLVELKPGQSDLSKSDAKTLDSQDSLPQGSLSSYSNCKQYFAGNWKYNMIDIRDLQTKEVYVQRTLNKTFEFMENKKYYFEYSSKWISDCKYELTFVKTTQPNFNFIKKGEKITVEIVVINNKEMKYITTFRGQTKEGEMTRSN